MLGSVCVEQVRPSAACLRAVRPDTGREMLADAVGDEELCILGPPIAALGEADLLLTERFAMGGGSILLVRRAVADMAIQNDKGRAALRLMEYPESVLDQIDIVGVADPQHVPPVTQEPRRNVLGEGDARAAFDRDVIVVVDPAQVVEAEVTGQRRSFRADALHHAAVAADGINVVVEHLEARPVVTAGEPFLRDRHADARGDALAERTGRGFDAGHPVVFGMPRGLAVELAEMADVVERNRGLTQYLVIGVYRLGPG